MGDLRRAESQGSLPLWLRLDAYYLAICQSD
jgi:hypothetical protein